MRPRQACLGIPEDVLEANSFLYRFNEAEASLPRNTTQINRLMQVLTCFNEAEASLPRNTKNLAKEISRGRTASMRPRQACLGIQLYHQYHHAADMARLQ